MDNIVFNLLTEKLYYINLAYTEILRKKGVSSATKTLSQLYSVKLSDIVLFVRKKNKSCRNVCHLMTISYKELIYTD